MAEKTLNRTIGIAGVYEEPSRRFATMTFFLSLREESVLPFTVAADSYLQNVLPSFYPRTPHKAQRSRANRPARCDRHCSSRPFDSRISDRLACLFSSCSISSHGLHAIVHPATSAFLKVKKLVKLLNKAKQYLLRGSWVLNRNSEQGMSRVG